MKIKTALKIIYMLLALGFMIYYLAKNWGSLIEYEEQFDVLYMLLAFLFLWLAMACHVVLMKKTFADLAGVKIGLPQMFRVFNLANLGRYLPGKLWSVMGMYYFAGEYGVSKKNTTLAVVGNEICFKGAGLFLGVCYLLFSNSYREYLPLLTVLLIVCIIALHPRIIGRLINFALKILKKDPIEMPFSYPKILKLFIYSVLLWLIYSAAFYVLVRSITPLDVRNLVKFAAILPLSWTIGYIALFAPGGFGVREGMLVLLLGEMLPPEVALAIAVVQRIWFLLMEGTNALIALAIPARPKTISTGQ
jgi:uncharacterized membrane protein YbhN (UPF0104 family)